MKILLLSDQYPPESPGGAGRSAQTQARALRGLGHDVHVLTTTRAGLPSEAGVTRLHASYPLRWRAYLSLMNPAVVRQVAQVVAQVRPDVIHAHNVHTYLTYASLKQPVPVVLTAHDTMLVTYGKFTPRHAADRRVRPLDELRRYRLRYFPPRNLIIRRMVRRHVDVLVTPTQALADLLQANGIRARRLCVIPNGIDVESMQSTAGEQTAFRRAHALEGRRVILFAGRVSREKGADQLLAALQAVTREVPNALLLILAREEGGEKVIARAETLGIRDYLRFAGWLDGRELAAAFGAAYACVVPSIYFDNLPTVALEAQAAGTPVITTTYGGVQEAIREGETGFAVNPHHTEEFAARLLALLTDDALREQMGAQAARHARGHFGWLAQGEKLVEVYQELLKS